MVGMACVASYGALRLRGYSTVKCNCWMGRESRCLWKALDETGQWPGGCIWERASKHGIFDTKSRDSDAYLVLVLVGGDGNGIHSIGHACIRSTAHCITRGQEQREHVRGRFRAYYWDY